MDPRNQGKKAKENGTEKGNEDKVQERKHLERKGKGKKATKKGRKKCEK